MRRVVQRGKQRLARVAHDLKAREQAAAAKHVHHRVEIGPVEGLAGQIAVGEDGKVWVGGAARHLASAEHMDQLQQVVDAGIFDALPRHCACGGRGVVRVDRRCFAPN